MRLPIPSTPHARTESWSDRLTLLLESTGEGIFGIDLDGRCIFVNRAGAQLLGYRPDELLGRNMHELVHHSHADGAHYPECDCPIFNAFRRGLPCRIDSEVFWRRDGTPFPTEYSSYPILDEGRVEGAVITFVDISERRRAQEQMRRANEVLEARVAERTRALSDALARQRELSAHLDAVREQERTRIAREIHDELGSLLVALKMDVAWLGRRVADRPELTAKCRAMGGLIETAVDNVGRIITDLRPSILDHQGLWAALEWHAQEFCDTAELACESSFRVDPGVAEPSDEQAIAVFRIFQEMLSNVARHARARSVRIAVHAQPERLRIEVRDDGVGAPDGALDSPRAYGVLGMRERARHFGGDVVIASSAGAGTCAALTMPLAGAPAVDPPAAPAAGAVPVTPAEPAR
jgi:PAS domain S-box-containing protein